MKAKFLIASTLLVLTCLAGVARAAAPPVEVVKRYVSIDNVCAWPNLTVMPDGTIMAVIFNQPSHARMVGDVDCWASADGSVWTKAGTAAVHEGLANRMNVAAGRASSGELVVLASGWSLREGGKGGVHDLNAVLPAISSRSRDGKTWAVSKEAFPTLDSAFSPLIPFGDILPAEDGSLRATGYEARRPKPDGVVMLRSDDDGKTWTLVSRISEEHNETAILHLGKGVWLAAARRGSKKPGAVDLFRSEDDGKRWKATGQIGGLLELPGHLLRLKDGRILYTAGNRTKGKYGVVMQLSSDEGTTWTEPASLVSDLVSGDCGYPSSVQRPDGLIVTAYYSNGTPAHQRYHMATVIWKVPARNP